MFNKVSTRTSFTTIPPLWWPTTVNAKPKTSRQKQNTSRQNQKPHGKNKIPHGKTKNFTAKTKYLTAKPKTSRQKQNTSRQNQILHSKSKIALVLPWVFAFAVRYLVFAVKYLVLPWSFYFCLEVFGFAVRYFVFVVRFFTFGFAVTVVGHRPGHGERRSSQNAEALAGCWSCDLLVAFTGDGRLKSPIPKQIVRKVRTRKYNGRKLGRGKAALSVPFFPVFPDHMLIFKCLLPMRHPY